MTVTFEFPADIEQNLRRELDNMEQTVKEAALVELYRQERITQRDFARALGISRLESEAVLKRHNVTEDFPTDEELQRALARLAELPLK